MSFPEGSAVRQSDYPPCWCQSGYLCAHLPLPTTHHAAEGVNCTDVAPGSSRPVCWPAAPVRSVKEEGLGRVCWRLVTQPGVRQCGQVLDSYSSQLPVHSFSCHPSLSLLPGYGNGQERQHPVFRAHTGTGNNDSDINNRPWEWDKQIKHLLIISQKKYTSYDKSILNVPIILPFTDDKGGFSWQWDGCTHSLCKELHLGWISDAAGHGACSELVDILILA